jgi:hypothetical protein
LGAESGLPAADDGVGEPEHRGASGEGGRGGGAVRRGGRKGGRGRRAKRREGPTVVGADIKDMVCFSDNSVVLTENSE